jgi:lipocalin-like protein
MIRSYWILVLALALTVCLYAQPASAQVAPKTGAQILLGVWQLVSAKDYRPSGAALDWMGNKPSGTIIYTAGGRMAVQFMRDPRATFTGTSMWTSDGRDLLASVTPSEIRDAYTGYYAYFGTYSVDESARTVTHHIQASVRPEEVGRNYVRPFEFTGDQLVFRYPVSAADGERRTRVIIFTRSERF